MNETKTMIKALHILSQDIQSGDGVANACVADAANMIESLSEQLAKANESALFYKEQYEKTDRECTKLAMREAKANERENRLEKILQRYESEQLQPLKLRVKELEKQRETGYEVWQAKYQKLKDSTGLINCYECDAPVHELSPRSRCCMCEYGRAQFNERENEQLRKEQE